MSDSVVRHLVAALAAVITLLAYVGGYYSGQYGWWWTAAGVFIIYGSVYKTIDAGGHGHGGGHH